MKELIFCLNATMPVFLLMILGYIFRRVGVIDLEFADKMNRFVFLALLPALLFKELSLSDFSAIWDFNFNNVYFINFFEGQVNSWRIYSGQL